MSYPPPPPASTKRGAAPSNSGRIIDGVIAVGFPALAVGYLVLYLATELPELRGEVNRAQLLRIRTLLPEQAAEHWFGTPPSFALVDRLPVLGLAIGIIVVACLLGRLMMAALRVDRPVVADGSQQPAARIVLTRLERFLFSCGIGLNALSLLVLAAGLVGGLNRWCFVVAGACLVLVSAWHVWRRRPHAERTDTIADDGISLSWLWLAAPFVVVIVLGGMLPPLDFDVREYHLQAPKEFFQDGKITFLRHNVYANMPLGSEMFSLLAMVLLDDWWVGALVGKTVIAAFGPLTALALIAAGRRFASPGAGIVAAVLYLSVPWVSVVSTSGLIEGALAFYLFLSVYAVMLWQRASAVGEQASRSWSQGDALLALAGFCSGGAVSCKYPGVLFVVLPLLAYVIVTGGKRPWKPVAIYGLAVLAGCGLWFGKNWALTGNPVYPLLYDWLGGATRDAEKNGRWLQAHSPQQFSLTSLLSSVSTVVLKSSWLSPVLAPLAVVGLMVRRYRPLAFTLAGYFAFIIAAWWLFTHRIDRFWLPAMPLLAMLAGLGAVWSMSLAWRRMVLGFLVVGLCISFIYVTSPEVTYNAYFISLPASRRDANRVNMWHLALNDRVPPGWNILSVGDAQVFDMEPPVIYNTAFDDNRAAAIFQDRGALQISSELQEQRISHVFVNWAEVYRYRQPGNYGGMPDFITPEWFAGLVRQGVLEAPWQHPLVPNQEVYPVRVVAKESRADGGSLPLVPTAAAP